MIHFTNLDDILCQLIGENSSQRAVVVSREYSREGGLPSEVFLQNFRYFIMQ